MHRQDGVHLHFRAKKRAQRGPPTQDWTQEPREVATHGGRALRAIAASGCGLVFSRVTPLRIYVWTERSFV